MNKEKINYKSDFRIIRKGCKYIPQYFENFIWVDVKFGNMWDNYSGRYSFINAKQRLYIYIGREKIKEWGGYSIFEVGCFIGCFKIFLYFDFIQFSKSEEYIFSRYKKYKGKTDFMIELFPELSFDK